MLPRTVYRNTNSLEAGTRGGLPSSSKLFLATRERGGTCRNPTPIESGRDGEATLPLPPLPKGRFENLQVTPHAKFQSSGQPGEMGVWKRRRRR